jgi:hypothetical protein
MLPSRYALAAGPSVLPIFSDASYSHPVSWGAWAYFISEFGLRGEGSGPGPSVEFFELVGALKSLETVIAIDRTQRAVRLHSDSAFCLSFLRRASERAPLPRSKAMDRVADLYARAVELTSRRIVHFSKVTHRVSEHNTCHRCAAKRLRHELAKYPTINQQMPVSSEEQRLECLLRARGALQYRLREIDEELVTIHERIQAHPELNRNSGMIKPVNQPG